MKNHFRTTALGTTLVVLLACLSGCFFGPSRKDYAVHLQPRGSMVTLSSNRGFYSEGMNERRRLQGELIEVDGDGLVLIAAIRIDEEAVIMPLLVRVPFAMMEGGRVSGRGDVDTVNLQGGERPSATALRHLRMLSRYPYGMPDEAEARLLSHLGQVITYEVRQREP